MMIFAFLVGAVTAGLSIIGQPHPTTPSEVFWGVAIGVLAWLALSLFFLPLTVAKQRGIEYRGLHLLLWFLFAWTGLGWCLMLAWALFGPRKEPAK